MKALPPPSSSPHPAQRSLGHTWPSVAIGNNRTPAAISLAQTIIWAAADQRRDTDANVVVEATALSRGALSSAANKQQCHRISAPQDVAAI